MKKIVFLTVAFSCFALASAAKSGSWNPDIVERVVNFSVFAAMLYYFLAGPIKSAYKGRIEKIATRLQKIEDRLKESKMQRDQAVRRVETAKENAAGYIETAQKEAEIMQSKMKEELKAEISSMKRGFEDQKEFEKRKMTKNSVNEILSEIFDDNSVKFDQNELVNLVVKKVG